MDSIEFDRPGGDDEGGAGGGHGLTNLSGKQIGRYLLGQPLGSGGAATVYRAYDQVQGITVALKLLLPGADEKSYSRFRREATLAGALRHPHIVRILQIGVAPKGEVAYIAMELVEGDSLAELLSQRGRLRPEETANLLEPIARALAYAHREGVVHRDVKPGNILLRPVSPGAARSVQLESLEHPVVPLLSDFGIARALDAPELTSAGRTVGTPAYMAPEQCAGSREVDGRADVYALGAVLYRCVSGRLPFTGTTTQILHAQVYDPLTIDDAVLRILPPIFVEILQRSMAKNPEDRYTTADQMADDLALAAGRTPPRPDVNAAEATATLTLSSLPATTGQNPPSTTTVLVAGTGTQARIQSTAQPARPQESPRTTSTGGSGGSPPDGGTPPPTVEHDPEHDGFGSRLERMNWAGVAIGAIMLLALIGGIVLFGATGAGLLDRVVGQPTPTPGQISLASATPTYTPTATPTPPPTDTPQPATPTVQPTATETLPPPPPTDAPPPPPPPTDTPTPEPTVTPTYTPMPTATITATPELPPGPDPTLVACLQKVDPLLRDYLSAQPAEQQMAFGCPETQASVGAGYKFLFERGYMVGFEMAPDLLVVYEESGEWERAIAPGDAAPPPDIGPEAPPGRFGWLWTQGSRREELGNATSSEPMRFDAVYQTFPSAVMVGDQGNLEVTVLTADKQR